MKLWYIYLSITKGTFKFIKKCMITKRERVYINTIQANFRITFETLNIFSWNILKNYISFFYNQIIIRSFIWKSNIIFAFEIHWVSFEYLLNICFVILWISFEYFLIYWNLVLTENWLSSFLSLFSLRRVMGQTGKTCYL